MTAAPLAAVLGRAAGGDECDTAHDDGGDVMLSESVLNLDIFLSHSKLVKFAMFASNCVITPELGSQPNRPISSRSDRSRLGMERLEYSWGNVRQ